MLKKRKLVSLVTRKSLQVRRGPSYAPTRQKKAADLTKEMLDSGEWKTTPFKAYNFLATGQNVGGGYLHPLLKVRAEFRKIFLEMGFSEMPTSKWVESSFWNFDSLFQGCLLKFPNLPYSRTGLCSYFLNKKIVNKLPS